MSDGDQMQHQTEAARQLSLIIQAKTIPNALLFAGAPHTGKKEAAFSFAKGINCISQETFGCKVCTSCKKIDSQSHPDMLVAEPASEKKNISVAQIRKLNSELQVKSNEARYRMALILDAQTMNTQAQNALLKTLEEPPAGTFFILAATSCTTLLPTILSRCRQIRFKPVSDVDILNQLCTSHGLPQDLSRIAAQTFEGDLQAAMEFSGISSDPVTTDEKKQKLDQPKADWPSIRLWLFKNLNDLILSDNRSLPLKGVHFSTRIMRYGKQIPMMTTIIKTFFRDLMVFKYTPEKIVNLDFSHAFADINEKVPNHLLVNWMHKWIETEKRIESNSSVRLALDRFFLRLTTDRGHT